MKAGTQVTVTYVRPEGDVKVQATIRRATKKMLPLPAEYVPVRFTSDGATALVNQSFIKAS